MRGLFWMLAGLAWHGGAGRVQADSSLFVLYFETPPGISQAPALQLERLVLEGVSDTVILAPRMRILNAQAGSGRQLLLCEQSLPPGRYQSLRFFFTGVPGEAPSNPPAPPPEGVAVPWDWTATPGGVSPAFLLWNPARDRYRDSLHVPHLEIREEDPVPAASLAYISNEGSHYLTCIDRFRRRVVDLIATGRGPRDMAYAPSRQELYVANSASDDISVIDVHAGRVEKAIPLRGGDEPSRMALGADESRLYVLNAGSGSLSIINLLSYQEDTRIHLETAPASLAVDDLHHAVYLTGRDSDRLSALHPGSSSITPLYRFGVNVDEIAFNARDRKLYVLKTAQRQVAVLDLASNAVESSIRLCAPASGFAFRRVSGTLFAAMPECLSLAVLNPGHNLEAGVIHTPHAPGRIRLDPEAKQLYVLFPGADRIAYYNANSWEIEGVQDVGKSPFAVAFVP